MLRVFNPISNSLLFWNGEMVRVLEETGYKGGDSEMVDQIRTRLYALIEIRRSFGRMIKKELDELMADGVLTQDDADAVAKRLAFKFCAWDLYPPKKPEPAPNPDQVKAEIRSRLVNGSVVSMPFPDLHLALRDRGTAAQKLPEINLEEMLRMHLKPRE